MEHRGVTIKGNPLTLVGTVVRIGDKAPDSFCHLAEK